ncbi:LysR family transcriptional regulator [Streptomyces gilvus]|uniref:LysR family transcriptional regulator n=1 Tax=Streptomyces gilvus TaxID=2920937 RepID=UPI001F0EDF76|nr:LysR family transcriptional regulator [Streptomyces sp. CME 23]MCH5674430.1 LysR family transcriptional regulator [Streptomyces sp. CME 23]
MTKQSERKIGRANTDVIDIDLRRLRYFVTVAEELSFVRAAERLDMTQPALSRQIRALEEDLRASLLQRGPLGTVLTPAGGQLLEDARPLLAAALALQRRVRRASRAEHDFTIGLMPGVIVTPILRQFRALAPEINVQVLHTALTDQVDHLLDGRVDVCFVRLPLLVDTFEIVPLFPEPRVLALADGHPLAQAQLVDIDELTPYRLLQEPGDVPEWRGSDFDATPAPHRPKAGLPVSIEESLEAVASGTGFIVVPAGLADFYRRPDIRYVQLTGVAPRLVALAYARNRKMPSIDKFVKIVIAALGSQCSAEYETRLDRNTI